MDSFKFHDVGSEKAKAISRQRGRRRMRALFRFVELFIFLIILSRFSTQFAFSLKIPSTAEYFRGIQLTLISPRFVFLVSNAIVIVLFLISGQFSTKSGGRSDDFYDEYMEKCRSNIDQRKVVKEEGLKAFGGACMLRVGQEERRMSRCKLENIEKEARGEEGRRDEERLKALGGACKLSVGQEERRMSRCKSERAARGEEGSRDLRRSMSEKCRGSGGGGRKACTEDEMSSEEFRRTVEAFIARQQRFLREE